jgi:hypothetical protein
VCERPGPVDWRIAGFLARETQDIPQLVDLGAGKFEKLSFCADVPDRIGVEICEGYVRDFALPDVTVIQADMRDAKYTVIPGACAMMIDSLEHIPKTDGVKLLKELKARFSKIILFVPTGLHVQTGDPWGYGNPWQEHKSSWWPQDLTDLGFTVDEWPDYHAADGKGGAMFAVWQQ